MRPTHYDLVIKTDLQRLAFEGEAIIQLVRETLILRFLYRIIRSRRLDVKEESSALVFNFDSTVKITHLSLEKVALGDSDRSQYVYNVPALTKE